jgi:hypothetical protein
MHLERTLPRSPRIADFISLTAQKNPRFLPSHCNNRGTACVKNNQTPPE